MEQSSYTAVSAHVSEALCLDCKFSVINSMQPITEHQFHRDLHNTHLTKSGSYTY